MKLGDLKKQLLNQQKKVNEFLEKHGTTKLSTGSKLSELLKRTEITYEDLAEIDENRPVLTLQEMEEAAIQIKYEGYIKMEEEQVEKFKKWKTNFFPKILIILKLKV